MTQSQKNTLTPRQLAQLSGRPLMSIYLAIWDGKLVAVKGPDGWQIDADSSKEFQKRAAEHREAREEKRGR